MKKTHGTGMKFAILALGFCLVFFGSFWVGRYDVSPMQTLRILLDWLLRTVSRGRLFLIQTWQAREQAVVINVRLPRVAAAALVGAALSTAGCSYQGMFRNPMVSPDLLGASTGACFGAALAILLGLGYTVTTASSFLFGLIVVVSKDLGSAIIFLAIFIVMLIASGVAWYWLGLAAAAVAAMIPLFWNFILADYQKNRILAPYIPDVIDPTGTGITWQTRRTQEALASGRLTGVGRGNGIFAQGSFDAKHTDCIFASIGEEMGMIACIIIIVLLAIIIIRCCVIGVRSGSSFGMLICFGVAAALAFQTFINVGMCMGISPVIGITLPFFSYGGSSMLTTFAAAGLVSGVYYRSKADSYGSEHRYLDIPDN